MDLLWKIMILTVSFHIKFSFAALDANAVLMDCQKDSSKKDIKRNMPPYHTIDNCTRKIRITLNITNTGMTPPDLDYSFLSQISDPESGMNMYLLNPVVLRLRQDQVLLAYPFNYLSAVNGKVSEIVVNYENTKNFSGCDVTSKVNPTCGLKHDRGKAIPFSEGFCCFCPEMPSKKKQMRGGQDCSLDVGDPADVEKQKYKASAHCLELNDVWYSVSALNEPIVIHETFMQVYNQRHLKNGSSVWVALTHDEDFELGSQNPYQYDENKTIVISYVTSSAKDKSVTIPIAEQRLLTPQPMPAVELAKLPAPVKNGATDYLLIPKGLINPDGDDCDVSGTSYEAFANQNDRCNVVKDTCLKNQPLSFWEEDDKKRKAGTKGSYLLENYGTPYKDPIIVHPETKEHWLATEYYEMHLTVLTIEINADEIAIMSVGKHAQISKVISSSAKGIIKMFVSVLNGGLLPAKFSVQSVKCGFGVADSSKESIVIPPQMTQDILISTKPGSDTLDEEFTCTVEVSSELYGIVAKREVTIDPLSRCVCNFHCLCACLRDSLKCELMEEEEYQAAGFRGSLPILTAKPPYKSWFTKHPFLSTLAIILFLLLFGLIKGILGLAGFVNCGNFGMNKFLYQPKKIRSYLHPDLKNVDVIYDEEGYPIHPDTGKRVRVIKDEILCLLNLFFLFFWPCGKCRDGVKAIARKKRKLFDEKDSTRKQGKPAKHNLPVQSVDRSKESHSEKHQDAKKMEKLGKDSDEYETPDMKYKADKQNTSLETGVPLHSTGPVADPLNKELEQWQKGTRILKAVAN